MGCGVCTERGTADSTQVSTFANALNPTATALAVLKTSVFANHFSPQQLLQFAECFQLESVPAKHVFYSKGQKVNSFYILAKGQVLVDPSELTGFGSAAALPLSAAANSAGVAGTAALAPPASAGAGGTGGTASNPISPEAYRRRIVSDPFVPTLIDPGNAHAAKSVGGFGASGNHSRADSNSQLAALDIGSKPAIANLNSAAPASAGANGKTTAAANAAAGSNARVGTPPLAHALVSNSLATKATPTKPTSPGVFGKASPVLPFRTVANAPQRVPVTTIAAATAAAAMMGVALPPQNQTPIAKPLNGTLFGTTALGATAKPNILTSPTYVPSTHSSGASFSSLPSSAASTVAPINRTSDSDKSAPGGTVSGSAPNGNGAGTAIANPQNTTPNARLLVRTGSASSGSSTGGGAGGSSAPPSANYETISLRGLTKSGQSATPTDSIRTPQVVSTPNSGGIDSSDPTSGGSGGNSFFYSSSGMQPPKPSNKLPPTREDPPFVVGRTTPRSQPVPVPIASTPLLAAPSDRTAGSASPSGYGTSPPGAVATAATTVSSSSSSGMPPPHPLSLHANGNGNGNGSHAKAEPNNYLHASANSRAGSRNNSQHHIHPPHTHPAASGSRPTTPERLQEKSEYDFERLKRDKERYVAVASNRAEKAVAAAERRAAAVLQSLPADTLNGGESNAFFGQALIKESVKSVMAGLNSTRGINHAVGRFVSPRATGAGSVGATVGTSAYVPAPATEYTGAELNVIGAVQTNTRLSTSGAGNNGTASPTAAGLAVAMHATNNAMMSMVANRTHRSSATAITACDVIVLSRFSLQRFYSQHATSGIQELLLRAISPSMESSLRNIPFMAGISDIQIRDLAAMFHHVPLDQHEILFREGELDRADGNSMFFLHEGLLNIFVKDPQDPKGERDILVNTLGPGHFIGEVGLLMDLERTATITARESCVLLELRQKDFRDFVVAVPDIVQKFKTKIVDYNIALKHMIKNPFILKYFIRHCEQEYSMENIEFWMAARDFRTNTGDLQDNELFERARELVTTYIVSDAPKQVNVDGSLQARLLKRFAERRIDRAMFVPAEEEILRLMSTDSYGRFTNSELFKACLDEASQPYMEILRKLYLI